MGRQAFTAARGIAPPVTAATGAAVPSQATLVGGEDSGGLTRAWRVDISGQGYVNPQPYALTLSHSTATAGVASGVLVAANANRRYLLFQNDSDTVVYIARAAAAALNQGIRLAANGGAWETPSLFSSTAAWQVITSAAGKTVLVTEGT